MLSRQYSHDGRQRVVKRAFALVGGPRMVLVFLLAALLWQVVRDNLSPADQADWPWRLKIMDTGSIVTLVAVMAGWVLLRIQLDRSLSPAIRCGDDWATSSPADIPSPIRSAAARVFYLYNSGPGTAAITSIMYAVAFAGADRTDTPQWLSVGQLEQKLAAAVSAELATGKVTWHDDRGAPTTPSPLRVAQNEEEIIDLVASARATGATGAGCDCHWTINLTYTVGNSKPQTATVKPQGVESFRTTTADRASTWVVGSRCEDKAGARVWCNTAAGVAPSPVR